MDATRVIAGRDFLVWTKPFATANVMPADTILWGASPGTGWVEAGLTVGGLNVSINIPRTEVRVDQLLDPVLRIPTGRDMRMTSDLAEVTAANIQTASGVGSITTVAAISGTRGHDQLDVGASVAEIYNSILFDIKAQGDGEAFRILGYKALNVGNVTMAFRDTAAAVVHLEAGLLPDTSTNPVRIMSIRDVIPALP